VGREVGRVVLKFQNEVETFFFPFHLLSLTENGELPGGSSSTPGINSYTISDEAGGSFLIAILKGIHSLA
jgi:hypothetical protein